MKLISMKNLKSTNVGLDIIRMQSCSFVIASCYLLVPIVLCAPISVVIAWGL